MRIPPKSVTLFVVWFLTLLGCRGSRADDVYTFIIKKQEAKAQHRWSLLDWFDYQDKKRAQDLWLAAHSSVPAEFYFGADYSIGQTQGPLSIAPNGLNYRIGAYVQGVGVVVEREALSSGERWHMLAGFRIFGSQIQGTHLSLLGGLSGAGDLNRPMFMLESDIYLTRFFGGEFVFRRQFGDSGGNRFETGVFVDFRFIRVLGTWFDESHGAGRRGTWLGLKVFF